MATTQKRAGLIQFAVNGVRFDALGNFTYGLGKPKREGIVGASGPAGYKETAQIPFIEGEIVDSADLDLASFLDTDGATVTLKLGNGKTIALSEAYNASEGTGNSEDGKIAVRFEGKHAEEIGA